MNARFQYLAGHLHALGPRAVYELLREVDAGANVLARLERYGQLDPEITRALGADELPSLRVVNGGRL